MKKYKKHKAMILAASVLVLVCTLFAYVHIYLRSAESLEYRGNNIVAQEIVDNCLLVKFDIDVNKESCYAKEFEKVAYEEGYSKAFEVLGAVQQLDPSANGCHFIAHGIGYGAYQRDRENWRQVLAEIDTSCSYGAPMGIVERYTAELPHRTISKELVPDLCGDVTRGDCNHVVGHILLADESTEGDIDKALDLCSALEGLEERDKCNTGVFMENITALNLIEHGYATRNFLNWPARLPDLEKLCFSYEGEYHNACWTEITHAVVLTYHNNPEKALEFCNKTHDINALKRCTYHSLGIIAGSNSFQISNLSYLCELEQPRYPEFRNHCYHGIMASTLSSIPGQIDRVLDFCSLAPEEVTADCFGLVGSMLRYYLRYEEEEVVSVCSLIPDEYESICREGKVSFSAPSIFDAIN